MEMPQDSQSDQDRKQQYFKEKKNLLPWMQNK
jgi:hypothetical protein